MGCLKYVMTGVHLSGKNQGPKEQETKATTVPTPTTGTGRRLFTSKTQHKFESYFNKLRCGRRQVKEPGGAIVVHDISNKGRGGAMGDTREVAGRRHVGCRCLGVGRRRGARLCCLGGTRPVGFLQQSRRGWSGISIQRSKSLTDFTRKNSQCYIVTPYKKESLQSNHLLSLVHRDVQIKIKINTSVSQTTSMSIQFFAFCLLARCILTMIILHNSVHKQNKRSVPVTPEHSFSPT